jgi:PAS domain S-box-containing protein
VEPRSEESLAFSKLSFGILCLANENGWITTFSTENISSIIGISSTMLKDSPELWIDRIHPSDADAVLAALQTVTNSSEKIISFRFRDSIDRYRWIEYRCIKKEDDSIVGFIYDNIRKRTQEYTTRIYLAGRNSLSTLLESSDLKSSITKFLGLLGDAMVVDRSRLVRFRKDGSAFITHEWVRNETITRYDLPHQVPNEMTHWMKEQLTNHGLISIVNCNDANIPEEIENLIKECSIGAVFAIPAIIYGELEGLACFEVSGDRNWLPVEIEEAKCVLNGYSKSVERRIEDRKQIAEEFHLRRSEEKYRLLTSHSPVILFGIDSEGTFLLSEGLGLESMGAGAGEVVGKSVYQIYRNYPDVLEHINEALTGKESHGLTHIGDKCFELWFTPVYDDNQIVVGLSGVAVDITLRHQLEQQQTIMTSELDHRVKNNITAVMSLVNLSKQGVTSVDDFAKTLDGRLHALAVAHSTLAKSHWSGAWMRDVLILTLQPYMVGSVDRIIFKGLDIELPGILARPMCMLIHELATNAVKHGALSNDEGSVTVTTKRMEEGNAILLCWEESGGPKITGKCNKGTGTSLLEGLVDHEMNGRIDMNFSEDGLMCQITVPLDKDK